MASKVKIGYLDDEFRKTVMGRTQSRQSEYQKYQTEAIRQMNIPSEYFQMASLMAKRIAKGHNAAPDKQPDGEAMPKKQSLSTLLSQPGYSEAQSMTAVRNEMKQRGKSGTILGT
jgi:hypothetical protein